MDERVYGDGYLEEYSQEVLRYEPLGREEERKLIREFQMGNEASGEKLIKANLRFVFFCGRRLIKTSPLPFEDLISEGNIGLLKALECFDLSKDVKFITYAVWWIRQAMVQAIQEKGRIVRLPNHIYARYRKIQKGKEKLGTEEEVEIDFSEEEIEKNTQFIRGGAMSLDKRMGQDESLTFLDALRWEGDSQEQETIELERDSEIDLALDDLSEREAQILRLYFGLGGLESLTLEEIGKQYKLSKERVRQIKGSALAKMKKRNRVLEEYL